MDELKKKMFWMLFLSFTVLVLVLTGLSNYQSFLSAREELQQSMFAMADMTAKVLNPNEVGPWSSQKKSGNSERSLSLIYDNPAWIVVLDISGHPAQIYASDPDDMDSRTISEKTAQIVYAHEPGAMESDLLSSDGLCWYYPSGRALILISTDRIRFQLLRTLLLSLGLAVFFEIALYLICRQATRWMLGPIEASMKKQKQFIADASHELKTPVSVILANAEVMEHDPSARWLSNIEEEAHRMNALITSLLDLTRAEEHQPDLQRVDFSRLVQKQCVIMEAMLFEKHLELKEAVEEGIFVQAEPAALQQLCAILLDNASEHSSGLVEVRLFRQKRSAVLQVMNSGRPIPPEEREKIFERFYRSDLSRNRSTGRYGLGLAIARSIVERFHGTIQAGCQDGLTVFTATLRLLA